MAGEFEPWLGNRNATDQQKNEYIRKLKAALTAVSGYRVVSGSYVGDGNASQVISVSDASIVLTFMRVASTSGTFYDSQYFLNSSAAFTFRDAAPPTTSSGISAIGTGSFTVADTTYTNALGVTYVYFGIGI